MKSATAAVSSRRMEGPSCGSDQVSFAPGPDRQMVEQVREGLSDCLPALKRSLLDGSYRLGHIRRVWIPKASRGQRGLGIPDVISFSVGDSCLLV
jgi:RNA-directed DNA polymerase